MTERPSPLDRITADYQAAKARLAEIGFTCEGSLDVTRYGGILKARQLVGVRGAGPAFDGLYYVKNVTHKIKKMQ